MDRFKITLNNLSSYTLLNLNQTMNYINLKLFILTILMSLSISALGQDQLKISQTVERDSSLSADEILVVIRSNYIPQVFVDSLKSQIELKNDSIQGLNTRVDNVSQRLNQSFLQLASDSLKIDSLLQVIQFQIALRDSAYSEIRRKDTILAKIHVLSEK